MSSVAVLTPIEKKRNEIYNQMTEDTRQVSDAIAQRRSRMESGRILADYNIGALLLPIKADERKYGSNAFKLLAEYHNIPGGADQLYKLMNFADSFEKDFVLEKSKIACTDGSYLTVHHWMQLMKLSDSNKIEKMLKRIYTESLSATDVENEIRSGAAGDVKNVRSGGRLPKVPQNPVVILQRTYEFANKFTRWDNAATELVYKRISEMESDTMTPALMEKLKATLKMIEQADQAVKHVKEKLEENLAHVESALKDKPKADSGKTVKAKVKETETEKPAKTKTKTKEVETEKPVKTKTKTKEVEKPKKKKKVTVA